MTILVLDCDGVVVKGHAEGGRWDKNLARDLGIDPVRLQEHFFKPHWRAIARGEADMFDVLDRVWPQLGVTATPRDFVAYWFAADAALDADVLAQVDTVRAQGGRAFLATVQEHHRARYLMETLGLARHFDAILYSAALGAAKPELAFYERAHVRLGAAAHGDVLFLDDTLVNVEAAAAFGWRARHFRDAADLRASISESD